MPDILAVEFRETMDNIVDWFVNVGLKVLVFLVIVIAGWIISRALYRLVERLLDRAGFNRLAERSGLRRWTGNYRPSDLFAKIVYYGLLLLTLQLAFNVFGPNPVSDLINKVVAWLPRLIVGLVILIVAGAIANAVYDVIRNALGALSYGRLLARIAQVAIVALGLIAALNQVGVATEVTQPVLVAILATIAGVLIVGIGGGLVRPMSERWERMLARAEAEGGKAAAQMRESAQRQGRQSGEQPAYQGRSGSQAMQDVQRAADQAGREARESGRPGQQGGSQPGG